jgi:hypothetical protein
MKTICSSFHLCFPPNDPPQEFLVHRRVPLGFHAAWITEQQFLGRRAEAV